MSRATDDAERLLQLQANCGNSGCPCRQALRRGHGLTHCFLHNDPGPSLSVKVSGDKLLVNCQAGCDQAEIVKQLREMDMLPAAEERQSSRPEIVAEYDYRDEQGALLYQAVRMAPKTFRQRRPDGNGGWIWNLEGVRHVLYHLPELAQADPKRVVFVVEGEKDVERLADGGLVATTNPMGAGPNKWRPEYAESLRGRHVIVVPDNDDTGRQHMHAVMASLQGVAASTKWLVLPGVPPKGDVSDYLAEHTIEEFRALAREAGEPPLETLPHPTAAVAEAEFHLEGDEYIYVWHADGVGVKFYQLRRADTSGAIRGFIEVYSVRPDSPNAGSQWWNRIDLTTQSDRNRTMDVLRKLTGRENERPAAWEWEVNAVYQDCARRFLLPPPSTDLSEEDESDEEDLDPQYLFAPIALLNQLNLFLADQGSTKSYLLLYLAVCVVLGLPSIFGVPRICGPVCIFDWETDRQATRRRLRIICRGLGISVPRGIHYVNMGDTDGSIADGARAMRQEIAKHQARVAIIDSLTFGAGGDLNSPEIAGPTIKALGSLGAGVTKLVTAHPPKRSRRPGGDSIDEVSVIGSGLFEFRPRSIYFMKAPARKDRGDEFIVTMRDRKLNESGANGELFYEVSFDNAEHTVKFARVSQMHMVQAAVDRANDDDDSGPQAVLKLLARGPLNTSQLARALRVEDNTIRSWGSRLVERNQAMRVGGPSRPGKTTVWAIKPDLEEEVLPL